MFYYNLRHSLRILCCGRFRFLRVLASLCCACGVLVLVLLSLTSVHDKIAQVAKAINCDNEASRTFLQKLVNECSVNSRKCMMFLIVHELYEGISQWFTLLSIVH